MAQDDAPIRAAIPVALPSRAAGDPVPPPPPPPQNAPPSRRRPGARKPAPKRVATKGRRGVARKGQGKGRVRAPKRVPGQLTAAEVRALNAKRARALRAKRKVDTARRQVSAMALTPAPLPAPVEPPKRGRGRPPGSTNKPRGARGPGRPSASGTLAKALDVFTTCRTALDVLSPSQRGEVLALLRKK